jgi:hypothetical protein
MSMPAASSFRLGAAVLALLIAASQAEARPDVRSMTCEQTQALVDRSGAVVLTTGTYTYNRFVSRRGNYCSSGETARPVYVQTRDGKCRLYICEQFDIAPVR